MYVSECKTTVFGDAPQHNKACIFPFIYRDTEYNKCSTVDNDGVPWCSTKTDRLNNHIKFEWGNCASECPGSGRKYLCSVSVQ